MQKAEASEHFGSAFDCRQHCLAHRFVHGMRPLTGECRSAGKTNLIVSLPQNISIVRSRQIN